MRCSNGSYNSFHPVLDGKTISIRPTPAILSDNFYRVPLIVGYGSAGQFVLDSYLELEQHRTRLCLEVLASTQPFKRSSPSFQTKT